MTPEELAHRIDLEWEYEWRWDMLWLGWRRCLWLAVQIDLKYYVVSIVFFGLAVSWGRQLKRLYDLKGTT